MYKIATFATLILLAIGGASRAVEPSIAKLIEQLGHRSFAVREMASKQLRELGPAALPALRKAVLSKDEEVRRRAQVLIPPLEIEEALLPKRVTLRVVDRPLEEIVKDIQKQTGYVLDPANTSAKRDRQIAVDFKDLPFWDAMDKLARATGRGIEYTTYNKTIHLKTGFGRSPFVNVRGPFRLEARWFHEDRDLDLASSGKTKDNPTASNGRQLTLSVSILAEPRITFLKIGPAKVEEAIDSEGKSLLEPDASAAKATSPEMGRGTFRGESLNWSDVRLKRATETAKTARIIRGTIPARCVVIRRPVVATNKLLEATGTTFRAGSDVLQITSRIRVATRLRFRFSFRTAMMGRTTISGTSDSTSKTTTDTSSRATAAAVVRTAGSTGFPFTTDRQTAKRSARRQN